MPQDDRLAQLALAERRPSSSVVRTRRSYRGILEGAWDADRVLIRVAGGAFVVSRNSRLDSPRSRRSTVIRGKNEMVIEQDRIDHHGGPGQGAKPREILVGPEYLQKAGR